MSSIHVHSERSARTGIAIVWPANFPGSTDPELHATALFLGSTESVDYTKEDVQAALHHYLWPAWTRVTGLSMFGRNNDIPVLTLERTNLLVITRLAIKRQLEKRGIQASNEFAFNPHVTIAKESFDPAPREGVQQIHLESPVLWWGESRVGHPAHFIGVPA
jgi:2'-5' RNA ligase